MRFSLATLLIVTLWIATATVVWSRREAWVFDPQPLALADLAARYPAFRFDPERPNRMRAPDGRFFNQESSGDSNIYVFYGQDCRVVLYDFFKLPYFVLDFIDNDTILVRNTDETRPYRVFHRNHPEGWRGHFHRPELWALVALTAAGLWQFARLKQRANSA